jgi:lysophospholipase L1-like esterase
MSLERSKGGVIYDSIGLNGAQAKQQLKNTQGALNAAFKSLNSDLIILSYGINELFDHSWTLERYERELIVTLKALREAAPEAACLMTGPFAAMLRGRPHPELDALYGVQRALAAQFECAFWDARAAMGDTLKPWQRKGLARRDGIHLTLRGYQRIAELFEQSLELSFERWRAALKDATPLDPPSQPTLKVQQRR